MKSTARRQADRDDVDGERLTRMKNFALALALTALLLVIPASVALAMNAAMGLYAMGVGMVYSAMLARGVGEGRDISSELLGTAFILAIAPVPLLGYVLWRCTQ